MSLFNEDLAVFDEQQLLADNLARLRRQAAVSQPVDSSLVVYPQGYLPPEVLNAKRRATYLKAVQTHREYDLKRRHQSRQNLSKGGYTPKSR